MCTGVQPQFHKNLVTKKEGFLHIDYFRIYIIKQDYFSSYLQKQVLPQDFAEYTQTHVFFNSAIPITLLCSVYLKTLNPLDKDEHLFFQCFSNYICMQRKKCSLLYSMIVLYTVHYTVLNMYKTCYRKCIKHVIERGNRPFFFSLTRLKGKYKSL